jgi:hypothetical protein
MTANPKQMIVVAMTTGSHAGALLKVDADAEELAEEEDI